VLSGLLSRDKNVTVDKLPFLGDIPILGALFRSKRYQNNETELVVFVTPTSSEKHTHNQQEEMDKATQRLQADSIALGNQSQKQIKKQANQPTSTNGPDASPATSLLASPHPY